MRPSIKKLRVDWRFQEKGFFCGPACLQMVLDFFRIDLTQDRLFDDVIERSTGTRPVEAPCDPNRACYRSQVCYLCGSWECWDTDPEALTRTLNDRAPGVSFGLHYIDEFETGTRRIIQSIKRSVPSVSTVGSFNHWLVIAGFHLEDPDHLEPADEDPDDHPPVNGLYLLDPLIPNRPRRIRPPNRPRRMRLVPMSEWKENFGLVGCGPQIDKHIVIDGTRVRRRSRPVKHRRRRK